MRAWYTITIRMGVNNLPHTLPHVISLTEMGTVIERREDCELKKVRIAGVRFRIDDGISATRGRRKAPHYCWCLFEHQIAGERGGTRGNCPTILSCISQYLNPQTVSVKIEAASLRLLVRKAGQHTGQIAVLSESIPLGPVETGARCDLTLSATVRQINPEFYS